MKISEANAKDMVEFLSKLGYEPARKSGQHYWYLSPLREEKTPSFKVNLKLNMWYDFGGGGKDHGDLVNFGTRYFNCSVKEFLSKMDDYYRHITPHILQPHTNKAKEEKDAEIKVTSVRSLTSFALLNYLKKRKIPQHIAQRYCQEVNYELKGKMYYSIGFKNDAGGYALRNQYVKLASMPNTSTFINNGERDLVVFEGFFDFLSYKALYAKQQEPPRNFLILNSTSFFKDKLPIMHEHRKVHLFIDNDKTGDNCMGMALALDNTKFIDERNLYKNYNDLNDWLVNFGLSQNQSNRQHL
ncbi:toprim domain-containing protein [Longitalea arenae]|uniref:toprim domain-containing protein n=1 Tax=Longitalea arenae TaxID=2812558 RepID=UPI001967F11B|nr:toprim domain-containing protein [Longitalea arenae]